MTVAPITTATPTTGVSDSQSSSAAKQLSGNFDTFLTLLTAQLKNQDPLSPMDSAQFTQQLVQFSSVEQQINSNKNLESLISLTKSNATNSAVSYLGHDVTITDGTSGLSDGAANWNYSLDTAASTNALVVTDAKGKAVFATRGETGAGAHDFSWNGRDSSGAKLPDGTYKLIVSAQGSDGSAVKSTTTSHGLVSEVDLTGTEPMLLIGSMSVPLSKAGFIAAN